VVTASGVARDTFKWEIAVASEAPGSRAILPRNAPQFGSLLGFLAAYHVVWVTLAARLEPGMVRQIPFLWQIPLFIGGFAGAGIGGLIQLSTQRRAADIPPFLRLLLGGVLRAIVFFVALFLGARVGERLYGGVGEWIGSLVGFFLLVIVWILLARRPSSDKPPEPPSA
jgi:hypothetical protein